MYNLGHENHPVSKARDQQAQHHELSCLGVICDTLESPLDNKEIKPVRPKGNQPEYLLEGLMLKLKLQYFGYLV